MRQVVVEFDQRPPDGPLKKITDTLRAVLGRIASLVDVAMLLQAAGLVTAAASATPGTAIAGTRTMLDFADAGTDQARLVVHGKNSGAGSVTLALYDVTNAKTLATVVLTGTVATTYPGAWTTIKPTGKDHECELRVVGSGETPTLYTVHAQLRTLKAP